jgi:Integral peroxisomal membrane peroxin
MRRLVKWQWIDPEWTVAGAGFITAAEGSSTALTTGGTGAVSAAASLASNLSESLRGRFAGQAPGSPTSPTNALTAPSTLAGNEATKEEALDVDPDGWQYGDNAWEKMSKKSGLGRYTRRRKWVRRAVLVEVVERGYVPPEDETESRKEI